MLHTDKFKSGNIGECIQTGQGWMTPNKFELRAGSKSRKYKTSIRSTRQGITLQEYIEKGYLVEQTNTQAHAHTNKQTNTQTNTLQNTLQNKRRQKQTHKQTSKQTNKQTNKQTHKQTHAQTST